MTGCLWTTTTFLFKTRFSQHSTVYWRSGTALSNAGAPSTFDFGTRHYKNQSRVEVQRVTNLTVTVSPAAKNFWFSSSLQGTLHTARQLVCTQQNIISPKTQLTMTPHATICTVWRVEWCRSSVPLCAVYVHDAIFPFAFVIVTIAGTIFYPSCHRCNSPHLSPLAQINVLLPSILSFFHSPISSHNCLAETSAFI